jgi:NADPH-dependent glutamate synthase beta subunit-like oxidoreductase
MDIPLMNRLLAAGKTDEALAVVRRDIALPSILGRICPAPCEGACRRKGIDQAVSVCLLKRFAGDTGKSARAGGKIKPSGKKVAIIGAGPAGLSAGWYLQMEGIACTIFDAGKEPGGALRYSVPAGNLPTEVLEREIQSILDTGVTMLSGHKVDQKVFDRLRREYDAVLIATGDFSNDQEEWGVDYNEKGFTADKKTHATSLPGVFAAGNAIRSRKMAVWAAGQGREAAFSIRQYLAGRPVTGEPRMFNSRFGKLLEEEFPYYLLESSGDKRLEPGAGMSAGFGQEEVLAEAARCMHCDCRKLDNCRLRQLSEEYRADQRHYWNAERKSIRKTVQHELLVYEAQKCIKCSLCVRIAEKHKEKIGFTFIGRGFDVEIGAPLNEELGAALTVSAAEAAGACPTGALTMKTGNKK